ncbi:signal recognition particle-related / SRP-related [Zea mays]|uniref:Signal recognition particle subunit SRP68 n=1 Tax=Zea mays TaxID=4577 RepID=A0A1D6PAZ8_MAIZE|nr:signal recognition particle-related / SRP-related [Zea mays]
MAETYASYMKGALFSEQDKNIDAAIINFKNTRAIYEEPRKYGSIENELLCYQCIEEVEPMIDLCSHKLGGSYLQAHELLDTANDLLNEDGCPQPHWVLPSAIYEPERSGGHPISLGKKMQDIHAEAVKKRRCPTKKPYSRSIVGASLEVI